MKTHVPHTVSRRLVLRAAGGVAIGLPLLPSLMPRPAQAATPPRRFVVMFEPDGIDHTRFWPRTPPGPLTDASLAGTALAPLAHLKSKLLIPRGLSGSPRGFGRDGIKVNDHILGTQTRLTCDGLGRGTSIDQVVARAFNPMGKGALTLGVGRRDGGAQHSISYVDGRPAPREDSPFRLFRALTGLSTGDEAARKATQARRESVLDTVKGQFDRLFASPKLGGTDRRTLDMHLTAIRDLEKQAGGLCALEAELDRDVQGSATLDINKDENFPTFARLQIEGMVLALACGLNSSAVIMLGGGGSDIVFRWLNHTRGHHLTSHRLDAWQGGRELPNALDLLHEIDIWCAQQFALICDRLNAYEEGEGTALDNSVVMWCNELSEGKMHHYRDLPFVLAGSAGGRLAQGRLAYLTRFADPLANSDKTRVEDAPHNKLLTTILHALGVRKPDGSPITKFGTFGLDGTYDELLA